MDLYAELGVSKNADAATRKRAYRKKAGKHHPDKGGDVKKFQALALAYDVLSDPVKKERYDQTGSTEHTVDDTAEILTIVSSLLLQLIEQVDVDRADVVGMMRTQVLGVKVQQERAIKDTERRVAKRHKALARLVKLSAGDNFMVGAVKSEIEKLVNGMATMHSEVVKSVRVLAFLEDYSYAFDTGVQVEGQTVTQVFYRSA